MIFFYDNEIRCILMYMLADISAAIIISALTNNPQSFIILFVWIHPLLNYRAR
jgi:hypothetical protein